MRSGNVGVWTAVAAGLLVGVLFLNGCGQKVAAPLPFKVTTGTSTTVTTRVSLHGTVLDEQTGAPVDGAWVTLGTTARVKTGADGTYTFTNLLPGTYFVSISSAGYLAGGVAFVVGTADVFGANIQLTNFASIPNAEDVRGTETVEVSEEGVTTGTKAITSGVPLGELTVEEKKALFPATLVVGDTPVEIQDAGGDIVTESPEITLTYLEQSQCPTPASGTFGMSPEDVYTQPGTAVTTSQAVVVEGVATNLEVETPNTLLRKGSVVRVSNVPLAGFVLEANGEQGWTFSEPQVLTVNPANLTIPMNLIGAGVPPGTQIPFVDSNGDVHYAELRDDGSIELEVSEFDTYLMQTDFNIDVTDSEVTALLAAAKPVAIQGEIMSLTDFLFHQEIDPVLKTTLIALISGYLGLAQDVTLDVTLDEDEQIVNVTTTCVVTIEVVMGPFTLLSYTVTITSINGVVQEIIVTIHLHESGGGA